MKYAINGRFLIQRVTGVQRFEREIVKALDDCADSDSVCVVVPRDYDKSFKLHNLKIVETGNISGILWEQTSFYLYLKRNNLIGINLGNVAPLLKPDIVCIHDVKLVLNPQWFNWKYVVWSKINYINALKRGKLVLTVSNFSKSEIERVYPHKKAEIRVIDEGWQHIDSITEDPSILENHNLSSQGYYFSLYQSIPNKNFKWILNAAKANPDEQFVVSGWNNKKTNKSEIDLENLKEIKNITIVGFVTDGEMKSLLKNCKAFLFPSTYEGFGIPPLEALSVGAKVMVMDIPVMREVFGNSVQYLQNDNYQIVMQNIDKTAVENTLQKHSWKNGARSLADTLSRLR